MTPQETLNDRERKYGDFTVVAAAIQAFKMVARSSPGWPKMTAVQRETMDMMFMNQCRILYGDPMHADSWHNACGYAMLATEEFVRQDREMQAATEVTHPQEMLT